MTVAVVARDTVTQLKPIPPNPDRYVFDSPRESVVQTIGGVGKRQLSANYLFARKRNGNSMAKIEYAVVPMPFTKLTSFGIYGLNGQPLQYMATYTVGLTEIGSSQTEISVVAINPRVFLQNKRFNIHTFRFDQPACIPVKATGIEEYEIIYLIGQSIKQKGMPSVNYP
jgi:hypothetical protein